MNELFFALWFFLPAGIANVTPIFVSHIPFLKQWNYPLDFGHKQNGKRIFGDHKTIRGLVSGVILGTFSSLILFYLSYKLLATSYHLPYWYYQTNPILLGFLLSFGALLGDAVKSFFKRQLNVKPGNTWIPFDQIDYIAGGLLLGSFVHVLTLLQYGLIFVLWIGVHVLSTFIGYFLHLKDHPL
jgi:CDP-2,3-bis-(O-geranylgeranyl)-sn-glycerol synthase